MMEKVLNIKVKSSPFNKLETLEVVDLQLLNKVINSSNLQTDKYVFLDSCFEYENEKAFLLKIKQKIHNNNLKVTYKMSTSGIGRVFAFKGLSLGCMRRAVRHTLSEGHYTDIDMENCHPIILKHLCDVNGINCESLTFYCSNRDFCLRSVQETYNVSRDNAKKLFLILQYNGQFETWSNTNNLINIQPTEFIIKYTQELKTICLNLYNQNKDIEKIIIKSKKVKTLDNAIGTVASYILQDYERRLLEVVYEYIKGKNIPITDIVLCADGLMIRKECYYPELLNELSNYLEDTTDFKIKFTEKIMNEGFLGDLESEFIIDETKKDKLDIEYFKTIKDYENKKTYFELFVCKIQQPETLYLYDSLSKSFQSDVCLYKEKGIRECFRQLNSGKYDDRNKETKFIDEWLDDENIKLKEHIDFIPFNSQTYTNDNIYNTFKGFNPFINYEFNKELRRDILKPFNDLGIQICEGNIDYWNYFKLTLSHLIQKPHERLPIAFIIKGKQGTGKSLLLNVIGDLIGDKYYTSSSNVNDFFGTFAEGFVNKLLVNMNEVEGKDTVDFEGKMKSFITESKITINQKGIRPYQINNFARLIITTNKNNPIKIDVTSKDRRYVVFETTDYFLQPKFTSSFWTKLIDYFKKPSFIAALYDDLNSANIDNYNFSYHRPITKSYKNMRKLYVPNESLFFEYWIENYMSTHTNSNLIIDYNGLEFYDKFTSFLSQYAPENNIKSLKKFYIELEALGFPLSIIKPNNKTTIRFNPVIIYKYLLDRGWRDINENEIWDDNEKEEATECDDYNFSLI